MATDASLHLCGRARASTPDGRGALLFANFDPDPDGGYAEYLDLGKYNELYEKYTPFSEVLLLADCCRERKEGMPIVSSLPFFGKVRGATKRVLGYATQYSRMAGADISVKSQARGFFTKALLEGLEGKADCDPRTGIIDSDQLRKYIRKRVPQLAAAVGYKQRADFTPSEIPISLARRDVPKFEVTVRLPDGWRGDVALVTQPEGAEITVIDKRTVTTEQATFVTAKGIYYFVGGDIPRWSLEGSSIELESALFQLGKEEEPGVVTLRRKV